MSIFFATTILALITFIAFIINIGVFVKSKINLQNAVDAAAWSGAAVQARQLTNIAYLNWEMRNTFKEWMFKYYVLGNLSLDSVANASGQNMDFRMNTIDPEFGQDSYNFPSICINFSNTGDLDICKNYSAPGLPIFETGGLLNVDEATTALVNELAAAKSEDCAERSTINFLSANLWAYNVRDNDSSILNDAPEIASNRQGAFPQAFELALRIRNLEKFVNKAPFSGSVCIDPSAAGGNCSESINSIISSQGLSVSNERLVKAFFSAFRNIGSDHDQAMKSSFTLTELPPTPVVNEQAFSLSNILIPQGQTTKHYLDLKLMTMNYATFYTSFNPSDATITTSVGQVRADGQCDATKVALPVPGYPLGFVKNPRVLTYYAVKGEALFSGLFNPFNIDNGGIKITAFAAAKPFGGRIGPMLMSMFQDETQLFARSANGKNRSSPYLIGLNLNQLLNRNGQVVSQQGGPVTYVSGAPLPLNSNPSDPFWLTDTNQAVGGFTQDANLVFSIPNIAYDYPNQDPSESQSYYAPLKIDVVGAGLQGPTPQSGLYNGNIFKKLRNQLNAQGGVLSTDAINNAIEDARGPTLLDTKNYLIPTPNDINKEFAVDSYGPIGNTQIDQDHYQASFFAPLISDIPDSLYKNFSDIESIYDQFMQNQDIAIKKFKKAMNASAKSISENRSGSDNTQIGLAAARKISNINFNSSNLDNENPSCDSIAGRFIFFYQGTNSNASSTTPDGTSIICPKSLKEILKTFWTSNLDKLGNIYTTSIKYAPEVKSKLFTGYRPGPINDSSINGIWKRSIGSNVTENMFRNFYSTKLVQLKSLAKGGSYDVANANFSVMSEGNNQDNALSDTAVSNGVGRAEFQNPLNTQSIGIDINEIDH